jgi:hypothetical protein
VAARHSKSAESFEAHQIDPGTVTAGPFLHFFCSPIAVLRILMAKARTNSHEAAPTGVSALKTK